MSKPIPKVCFEGLDRGSITIYSASARELITNSAVSVAVCRQSRTNSMRPNAQNCHSKAT